MNALFNRKPKWKVCFVCMLLGAVFMPAVFLFYIWWNVSPNQEIALVFVQNTMKVPLEAFKEDVGRYPTTEEGLTVLISGHDVSEQGWRGPYLAGDVVLKDPWGDPYEYIYPGKINQGSYDLFSWGGSDRGIIGNWNAKEALRSPYVRGH